MCLTVHVQGRELESGNSLRGCIHLVDLAGSERADKSEATGDRLKEAQHINRSLSALGDVIASLAQKQSHVPYRNSKLTQLLQDSLGGQAKTLMFVHISPESEALSETISTLKFAERVSTVELGASRVNKDSGEVKVLKEQITSLKAALARMKDGELEHFKQRANSMTDLPKLKSLLSSSVPTSLTSGGRKLPRDDTSSLDPEDDKESFSGGMNRDESYDSLMGQSEVDSKQSSSPLLSPTYLFATSDFDELELATSEGSESDLSWQSHSPKPTSISNALVSRPKKSIHLKQEKNLTTRSMVSSLSPSSSRKQPILVSQSRKHSGSIDAKRRSGNA